MRGNTGDSPLVAQVVKVGGSLARHGDALGRALRVVGEEARAVGDGRAALVVPGGGPLADAVREVFRSGSLSESVAHRMGLLALDQSALWMAELAAAVGPAAVVGSPEEIRAALSAGALPVLAPSGWLAHEDSLPASWDVTSDSIAAWTAGRLGARRLLLLKSFGFRKAHVRPDELGDAVDAFFLRVLPHGVECRLVDGRDPARVGAALRGDAAAGSLLVAESAPESAGLPLVPESAGSPPSPGRPAVG